MKVSPRVLFAAIAMQLPVAIPGQLFVSDDGLPHPGVVVLHDSGDEATAVARSEARRLADAGIAALALDYSADLSQAYEAFRWLRTSEFVARRPTAFYGVGLGAEAALVLSIHVSEHAGLMTPAAVAMHAPVDRLGSVLAWNWQGSAMGFAPGRELKLGRTSFSLFVSHGEADATSDVGASRRLEIALREQGASVQGVTHPANPIASSELAPREALSARGYFHYFEGQGHVLSPEQNEARWGAQLEFFRRFLGN